MTETPFLTVMFTDLVGSTALFDRLGDEAADALRREHFASLRAAVLEHGGREIKSAGDGLMVAFTSAADAVRCAIDIQRATTGAEGGLSLRIGLDAGEPLVEGEDLHGTPVIVASRLCDAAGDGEVLASDVVRRVAWSRVTALMRPAGAMRFKGLSEPVSVAIVQWREDEDQRAAAKRAGCAGTTDNGRHRRRPAPAADGLSGDPRGRAGHRSHRRGR